MAEYGSTQCLGTWNQIAMRGYVRRVFCFPYRPNSDDLESLRQNLASALAVASRHYPDFAGQVFLGSSPVGQVWISKRSDDQVSLKVFDHRETFGWSYVKLKAQGFPAIAFVDPSFGLPYKLVENGPGAPATEVHARVIDGGLLLCIYYHHSITDGIGTTNFISVFATHTRARGHHDHHVRNPIDRPFDLAKATTDALTESHAFEHLMERCPEYVILPRLSGPTAPCLQPFGVPLDSIQKTGRIFAFGPDKIEALKKAARQWSPNSVVSTGSRYPSTFACLAALTWAHCTAMRMDIPHRIEDIEGDTSLNGVDFRLLMPASWARRAFQDTMKNYSGNAVALSKATTSLASLVAIACSSPASLPTAGRSWGLLVHSIESALASVDDEFIATRTAMFRAAPDPRVIGIDLDPRDARDFIFNSWRHLGADTLWGMPGIEAERPEAVRRAQDAWNMGAGLILPGSKLRSQYEVLVTLDTTSMARLCADDSWNSWVDGVVE